MRKLFKKSMPILMAGLMFFESIIPAFATVTDEHIITSNETAQTEVTYMQESKFEVTLPKLIDLGTDKLTKYTVSISGDISSGEIINVIPEDNFVMKDISGGENPKADITATVIQDKTSWIFNEFDVIGNGEVSAPDLSSGKWQGTFFFNIEMTDNTINENNSLVLSTDNLVMGSNESYQVDAFIDGENVNDFVSWSSDNENITVTNGLIETKASASVGETATITVEAISPIATFELKESSEPVAQVNLTVTIIDINFSSDENGEVISMIEIKPGESADISGSVIPSNASSNISWSTTATSGLNLIPNGNKVTIKVADDMPVGSVYDVIATCGTFSKLLKINIISDHSCEYEETITNVSTCTEDGLVVYKCKFCDSSYEEVIKATGHSYSEWTTTQNPACTEVGIQKRTCSNCGNTETKDIAVLGHNYSEVIISPTCTAQGYTTHTCSNCGDSYKDTYVVALGHTEEVIKGYVATCENTGLTDGIKCSVCNLTITEQTVIPAKGHTYGEWTTSLNPTCTVVGSQNRTCAICGEVESKEVAVLGHDWRTDYTVDKAATCTEAGSKSIHCTRCSVIKDVTTIPATGHTEEIIKGYTATCESTGLTDGVKCSICNIIITEQTTIPANGHTANDGECTVCGDKVAGLYDANGALLCTWEDSGIDVAKDYSGINYQTNTTSPYYVTTNNYPETKKVVIPDDIDLIGDYAFYQCKNLTNIVLPDNEMSIGDSAFWNCVSANITITKGIKNLGAGAFANCDQLTNVILLDGITTIPDSAFYLCDNLNNINIPNSVKSINTRAFYGCKLENLTIPESVIYIEGEAFYNTPWLKAKQNENPLVIINGILIDGTKASGNVIIPDEVKVIADKAFYFNLYVNSITIPSSVTSIGSSAFSRCTGLSSITIPNGVTSIESSTFYGCTSLTNITIPSSVTSIGYNAFFNTEWLIAKQEQNPLVIVNGILIDGTTASGNIVIPSDVNSISEYAFQNCTNLTEITIPNSVTSIGACAFNKCTGLTSIIIPDSVTSIGYSAFSGCTNLTKITIPNNLIITAQYVFSNTAWLTNKQAENPLVIVNNVLIDGTKASGNVIVPENVIAIAENAFCSNSNIISITIPKNVTYIGRLAFYGSSNLTNVVFDDTFSWYIGSSAEEANKQVDVSSSEENANNLSGTYFNYYWIKK